MKKIGFIGMGNMAQALVAGFTASGLVYGNDICAYAPHQDKLKKNSEQLGIKYASTAAEAVRDCDTVFMACKPYQIKDVVNELDRVIEGKNLVSVAAGWDYEAYRQILPDSTAVQCIMPNTPVAVSSGVILVEEENDWEEQQRRELFKILSSVGKVIELPNRLMTAGMAVSGCGPAFMDMVIEALADGAVKNGIPRATAYDMVCATMEGSARLAIDTGLHPGVLKDNVCSPGGTTIRGVASLESSGIRSAFIKAVDSVIND